MEYKGMMKLKWFKTSVDVIVTDHHEIGRTLPEALAIVHPMHPDFDYPFKYLCGAGVAYKLSQALLSHPLSNL